MVGIDIISPKAKGGLIWKPEAAECGSLGDNQRIPGCKELVVIGFCRIGIKRAPGGGTGRIQSYLSRIQPIHCC